MEQASPSADALGANLSLQAPSSRTRRTVRLRRTPVSISTATLDDRTIKIV